MPELPDIATYVACIAEKAAGQTLLRVRIANPFLVRTVDPPVAELHGKTLLSVANIGKRIVLEFPDDMHLVVHLMIAGRLHWKTPGTALAGRRDLAALDFEAGNLVLTEAGSKRRASFNLVRGRDAALALDPGGIDPLSCNADEFRGRLQESNHTLKRALTDPRIFSGIGNAYSDEILHRARLSPLLWTSKLDEGQTGQLYKAVREVLGEWVTRLGDLAAAHGGWPPKVTAFQEGMAVHGRYGEPCPVCGDPVQRIAYADNETNYCATCQTDGVLLADRSMSRLLKKDWPQTLEELEELRRNQTK